MNLKKIFEELEPLTELIDEDVEGIYFLITEMIGTNITLCYDKITESIHWYHGDFIDPNLDISRFFSIVANLNILYPNDIIAHKRDRKIKIILDEN